MRALLSQAMLSNIHEKLHKVPQIGLEPMYGSYFCLTTWSYCLTYPNFWLRKHSPT